MEEPSRDARRASPDPVLVVDVHRHAGIPRAMLKIEIAPASVQPISACRITHREEEEGKWRVTLRRCHATERPAKPAPRTA
jgi:hypothetical protein